ncbi:MAG: DUF2357 domain-containing protein [Oligoflexia bacterium]|nr:DUF2357 domain-containing protein [Oligoflexia bacterium]
MLKDYKQRHVSAQSLQQTINDIDSIDSLYKALSAHKEINTKAVLMLMLRSWLTEVSCFDPFSGCSMHTGIVDFMILLTRSMQNKLFQNETKDRIYRIVSHTKEAVLAIMNHTRDKIVREHIMLPIHTVREVDSKTIQWLGRQSGRTLREKLSGKPYIKAVRRSSSVDTSENRLLKAFFLRLEQILVQRQSALDATTEKTCEELLLLLQQWPRSENASQIGVWGNLPPNNALLQDKYYRKIWEGWLGLQEIDFKITEDSKRIQSDILSVVYWETLSLLNHTGRFRTIQQPIRMDYDNFSIVPELPIKGYLFPALESRIKGHIKNINNGKKFGFITTESGYELFFHKNNLSNKLDINSLKDSDAVSFVMGSNQQGDCADDIQLIANPGRVNFILSSEKIVIRLEEKEFLLQIDGNHLILIHQLQGAKKKFPLLPDVLKEIPTAILSLITNTSFECTRAVDDQCGLTHINTCVLDLCSIRPKYTNNMGSQILLPFRLLLQHWPLNINDGLVIDCAKAKAVELSSDIKTVSMRSLFLHNSTLSSATKSNTSMFFIKKLSDHILTDSLTYLIPDWGNEFDLECIRKSINFYFKNSTPLPRSMAAIFAWQSSKIFLKYKVRENDFVFVIDSFDNGVSITPIQAISQKELDAIIPEMNGISWERHPTIILENRDIYNRLAQNLANDGCQTHEELIQLFGFDGLISDAGEISFVSKENWYHLPNSIRETLNENLDVNILSNHTIHHCLNSMNRNYERVNVFILPLEDTIKKQKLEQNYKWLGPAWSPIKGSQTLNEWQKRAVGIALWRDHLPELSIRIVVNGRYEKFYLVKDSTVTPQIGRSVDIPVKEFFTLPPKQPHYKFPLLQGEGDHELQFVAYLKSSSFPLKEDTVCKLKMTYTYGADDPYELNFIPVNTSCADFRSIRVEWLSASDDPTIDLAKLDVPDFPDYKSWSDFKKFPKEDGENFSDLLEWVEREIRKIDDIANYGRVVGTIQKWIDKGDDNVFCFIEDTLIHKTSLYLMEGQDLPPPGDTLSFYKIKNDKGKFYGEDVAVGDHRPRHCFLSKSMRFPISIIWNNGHSLSESDAPDQFRNTVFRIIPKIISIIQDEKMPDILKEELFFFMSCLHKDAPGFVGTRLLDAVKDKRLLRKYSKNIAFAIGNAELPWQQELFRSVTVPIDNEASTQSLTMEILSMALWRSKGLIYTLTEKELETLSQDLYDCLELDIQNIVNDRRSIVLCKHLELLLALLRSRGIKDEKFKMILAPAKDLAKRYVNLIDEASGILIDNNIELKSLIVGFKDKKPEIFRKTPDLLYALRMYLTGDTGTKSIYINYTNNSWESAAP